MHIVAVLRFSCAKRCVFARRFRESLRVCILSECARPAFLSVCTTVSCLSNVAFFHPFGSCPARRSLRFCVFRARNVVFVDATPAKRCVFAYRTHQTLRIIALSEAKPCVFAPLGIFPARQSASLDAIRLDVETLSARSDHIPNCQMLMRDTFSKIVNI